MAAFGISLSRKACGSRAAMLGIRSYTTHQLPSSNQLQLADDLKLRARGRQSDSGVVATVFGASGFLGRYVVDRLGSFGSQCVCPYRGDGMYVRHLKLMGDLGQIVPLPVDFTNEDSIRNVLAQSNVVINLIGNEHQTANYSYHDTNVKCTFRLAKLAAETGNIKRFIHVSQLGASHDSPSEQLRTKAEGEDVVRDFFPNATIIRPAPIFGHEDKFLNRIAELLNFSPLVPMVNNDQQLQPVFVMDVAQAIINSLTFEDAPGAIVECTGPEIYSRANLVEYVAEMIYREDATVLNLPEGPTKFLAGIVEKTVPARWRLFTPDSVAREKMDFVETAPRNRADNHYILEDLSITPRTMQVESSMVLKRHRGARKRLVAPRILL